MIQNNRCELQIYDIPYPYGADVIHCFEHPMAAILYFYNPSYTGLYLALAKFRGVYSKGTIKEQVYREMQSVFGVEILEQKKFSYKDICQAVEQGIPMMVGVNLKEIFYSEYYKRENWGHWFLVKGYRPLGELVTVLDNTQFEAMGHEYGSFPIPFSMLQKANASYRKFIDTAYSCMMFSHNSQVEPLDILLYILNEYEKIDLTQENHYKQMELLSVLQGVSKNQGIDRSYYGNEIKKKLINVNKYRKLFHQLLEDYMKEYGFWQEMGETFHNRALELQELWDVFMMKKTLETARGEFRSEIPENIREAELEVRKWIVAFSKRLKQEKEHLGILREKQPSHIQGSVVHRFENNQENIMVEQDDGIYFRFGGNRIYNWWERDEAPKAILWKKITSNYFSLQAEMKIDRTANSENYEVGFFIRNPKTGESFLLGIENQENIVWDETNVTGHKIHIERQDNYRLFLRYEKGRFLAGMDNKTYFQYDYPDTMGMEIGVVCKTWGNGGPLSLVVRDIALEI